MNELVIKTRDFERAKNGLKEFSQKESEDLNIDTVETYGGFLWLGDHKVTGHELNERLGIIQKHLIDLNNTNNKTIKEFGQVYSALEALDNDYIKAILTSIKATEKTSESIKVAQDKIEVIVNNQKKTLEVLKTFKQKLEGYAHLEDIDKIWTGYQQCYNEITTLSNQVNQLNQKIVEIEAIVSFNSELEQTIQINKENADAKMKSIIENNDTDIQILTKKIKYAYIFAGGALVTAIISLLLKVI